MNYIAVAGVNGYGVYTDTKQLLKSKPYIKEYHVRCFKELQRAIKWSKNKYIKLQQAEGRVEGQIYLLEEISQLNWFYHR